jgi:hypothetical protein
MKPLHLIPAQFSEITPNGNFVFEIPVSDRGLVIAAIAVLLITLIVWRLVRKKR